MRPASDATDFMNTVATVSIGCYQYPVDLARRHETFNGAFGGGDNRLRLTVRRVPSPPPVRPDLRNAATGCFRASKRLLDGLHMPRSLKGFGVPKDAFLATLPELAMTAFEELSNRTNPRMPLVSKITTLLRLGYYGDAGFFRPKWLMRNHVESSRVVYGNDDHAVASLLPVGGKDDVLARRLDEQAEAGILKAVSAAFRGDLV